MGSGKLIDVDGMARRGIYQARRPARGGTMRRERACPASLSILGDAAWGGKVVLAQMIQSCSPRVGWWERVAPKLHLLGRFGRPKLVQNAHFVRSCAIGAHLRLPL